MIILIILIEKCLLIVGIQGVDEMREMSTPCNLWSLPTIQKYTSLIFIENINKLFLYTTSIHLTYFNFFIFINFQLILIIFYFDYSFNFKVCLG